MAINDLECSWDIATFYHHPLYVTMIMIAHLNVTKICEELLEDGALRLSTKIMCRGKRSAGKLERGIADA